MILPYTFFATLITKAVNGIIFFNSFLICTCKLERIISLKNDSKEFFFATSSTMRRVSFLTFVIVEFDVFDFDSAMIFTLTFFLSFVSQTKESSALVFARFVNLFVCAGISSKDSTTEYALLSLI